MALSRRTLLQTACCCAAGMAALDAFVVEPGWLDVVERELFIPGLPKSWQGFRIAHLSDVHLREIGRVHDAVFATIRQFDPNLIVLTGDTIEHPRALRVLEDFCRPLTEQGRQVVATWGNWEHWGHIDKTDLAQSYTRAGVRLLGNESVVLPNGLSIIATDDFCSGNDDVRAALRQAQPGPVKLFLTHAPGIFDELPHDAPAFDLGLAGHTHGGQIRALGASIWVPPGSGRFTSGLYETNKGRIYVSRGVGTSVVSARFTCRPELPLFRLLAG